MKKENFASLILGTIGGILFAMGMCMCLIPQWNAFRQGIVIGIIGCAVLLSMLLVRRKVQGKPAISLNAKTIGTVALGIAGALVLGLGMCMTMIWEGLLIPGIVVGMAGILSLISLVPICKGLQ